MFWPVITRPPAFQPCRVPDSDRQPSSLGLKQTLWNVLMGRELILGLNLSGSLVPPQVYIPAPHSPSLISWKQIVRTLKDVRHLGHYWYVWKFEFQTSAITLMALSLGTTIRDDFIQIPLFPDETLMLAMSAVKKKRGGGTCSFTKHKLSQHSPWPFSPAAVVNIKPKAVKKGELLIRRRFPQRLKSSPNVCRMVVK